MSLNHPTLSGHFLGWIEYGNIEAMAVVRTQAAVDGNYVKGAYSLIIDISRPVPPKHIDHLRAHQETADAHPQAVGKGRDGQRDDEDREERRDEHDKGLGRDQVQEEPHDPGEEGLAGGTEIAKPVRDD